MAKHPTVSEYLKIGAVLTIVTVIEVWLPSWPAQTTYNVFLVLLATIKFWFVIQFYMHLRQDSKVLTGFFALGLVLIGGSIWALLAIMNPHVGRPSQVSEATGHGELVTVEGHGVEAGDTGDQGHEEGGEEEPPLTAEEFEALVARGRDVATTQGCTACHTTDGTTLIAPSWQDLMGRTEIMVDGTSVVVDEAYLRESILDPAAKVVEGYIPGMMPTTYGSSIPPEDLEALVAYLTSL